MKMKANELINSGSKKKKIGEKLGGNQWQNLVVNNEMKTYVIGEEQS